MTLQWNCVAGNLLAFGICALLTLCVRAQVAAPSVKTGELNVPTGAPFPACWDYDFKVPEKIEKGKPFDVTIRLTTTFFTLENVTMTPIANRAVKLVKGEAWTGTLKPGEYQIMTLTLKATADGLNGPYGIELEAPTFYTAVESYVRDQKEGVYAADVAKESIRKQILAMKKENDIYHKWVGGVIRIDKREEKQP